MTTHSPPPDLWANPIVVPCCGRVDTDLPTRDTYCLHRGGEHVDCPGPTSSVPNLGTATTPTEGNHPA